LRRRQRVVFRGLPEETAAINAREESTTSRSSRIAKEPLGITLTSPALSPQL
jgi:hypothetical protein